MWGQGSGSAQHRRPEPPLSSVGGLRRRGGGELPIPIAAAPARRVLRKLAISFSHDCEDRLHA